MAAYEFRSIADVELKDQPVDSTTVIIEQDGVLARVPKDKVGVTSYNDLKDKPDYAALEVAEAEGEISNVLVECDGTLKRAPKNYVGATSYEKLEGKPGDKVIIEWDGNTEGKDSFSIKGISCYKVSDLIPTLEDISNSIVGMYGDRMSVPSSTIYEEGGLIFVRDFPLVVTDIDFVSEWFGVIPPSTGIYFPLFDGMYFDYLEYTKKISKYSLPPTAVQTAIIKFGNYDRVLLEGQTPSVTEINCTNMTFDEAWNLLTSGNPLNAIIMNAQDANNFAIGSALGLNLDLSNNLITILIAEDMQLYWTADGISGLDS